MNKDIYGLDFDEQNALADEIDKEVYALVDYPNDYPDDEDHGEVDLYGDEGY